MPTSATCVGQFEALSLPAQGSFLWYSGPSDSPQAPPKCPSETSAKPDNSQLVLKKKKKQPFLALILKQHCVPYALWF